MAHPPRLRDRPTFLRSYWLSAALLCTLTACGEDAAVHGSGSAASAVTPAPVLTATPFAAASDATILVDAATSGPMVNRLILGSNVQWVDGGDNLLVAGTSNFDPAMQALVQTMGPSILRYPGGDQSDLYDWSQGIGPAASRGINLQAPIKKPQTTFMGTGEMLALAQSLNASLLFTVNVLTGTAAGAAAWVRQTNGIGLVTRAGQVLPKVAYWEIGNEPYLPNSDGSQPNTCLIDPATYVARVNQFIPAMRAVDPTIKIGIAVANDKANGIQVVSPGCRGFAATVLKGLTQPVDFVSVHDAYLPYDLTGKDHPAADEYAAAMASTESIRSDFATLRALLQHYPSLANLPFAITEYNALYSLRTTSAYIHSMASPMGALYVADVLRFLASRDDVLMAQTWSLSGNDHWGAIHSATNATGPYPRPVYEVFRLFNEVLQGARMTATVRSKTFDAPNLGFSAAASRLPTVATLVTKSAAVTGGQVLRVLMINKDYAAAHTTAVTVLNASITSIHLSSVTAANVLDSDDLPGAMQRTEADLGMSMPATVTLPPHSIELLSLFLAADQP